MKEKSWIITANSSIAKIFRVESIHSLVEVATLEHPESRLFNRDLCSDKPGRDFESTKSGTRHSYEPQHTPKENECIAFSREIANFLDVAKNKGDFSHLYLVANPSMLGLLRKELSASVAKSIESEVNKDLTQSSHQEILEHFTF